VKSNVRIPGLFVLLACVVAALAGCKSTYYAAYEKVGVYKRDLLKKRVMAARDDQQAASEQFKDALTKLKEVYLFDGGKLEQAYRDLDSEYKQSETRAAAVRKRVADVETVGSDLFKEWEQEIKQISTPSLADGSRRQLRETRARFDLMVEALKKAERSMQPVLTKLHDYVLYLKHNLNAAAIASLRGEATNIQAEISSLITDMNTSIAKADEFIKTIQ
jgi:predicted  nucleic acid-binding Zn-ribbon protein